jgi:hypothetical protein
MSLLERIPRLADDGTQSSCDICRWVHQIDIQQVKCAPKCASTLLSAVAYPKNPGKRDSRSSRPPGWYMAALRKGSQCPATGSDLPY